MTVTRWLAAGLLALAVCPPAPAAGRKDSCHGGLHGRLLDYTNNHGADRRIYSAALCEKRDLYVYLPPGFDPARRYPAMLWLHGVAQDEESFLDVVGLFDRAMACGELPPMIVAAPDGSIRGRATYFSAGSFYVNSNAGNFEDYTIGDVWFGFIRRCFPVRPERDAHVIAGASMGGFGAYNLAFKYREEFRHIVGVFPALNLRYVDCRGKNFADFDPECFSIQEKLRPFQPVGRFFGVIVIRRHRIVHPLYGWGPEALARVAEGNPAEMLHTHDIKPGEFEMYAASGGRDEFNVDAQIASFQYLAAKRGIDMTVQYDPTARHNTASGVRFFPGLTAWLSVRLAPYAPGPAVRE